MILARIRRLAPLEPHRRPDRVLQAHARRAQQRRALRAHRPRLHAGLRHHRADQLRPRRPVHARHASSPRTSWSTGWVWSRPARRWRWLALAGSPSSSAMAFCAAINVGAERLAYRRLRRAPKLAPLITAVGVSFIFQGIGICVERLRAEELGRSSPTGGLTIGGVDDHLEVHRRHRRDRPAAAAADLDRHQDPAGQGDARDRAGPGRRPADGHRRQPHDLVHLRPRRRHGRRGRPPLLRRPSARRATTSASSSA